MSSYPAIVGVALLMLTVPTLAAPLDASGFPTTSHPKTEVPTTGAPAAKPPNFEMITEISNKIRLHLAMEVPNDDVLNIVLAFTDSARTRLEQVSRIRSEIKEAFLKLRAAIEAETATVFGPIAAEKDAFDVASSDKLYLPAPPDNLHVHLIREYRRTREGLLAKAKKIKSEIFSDYFGVRRILEQQQGCTLTAEGMEELKPELPEAGKTITTLRPIIDAEEVEAVTRIIEDAVKVVPSRLAQGSIVSAIKDALDYAEDIDDRNDDFDFDDVLSLGDMDFF